MLILTPVLSLLEVATFSFLAAKSSISEAEAWLNLWPEFSITAPFFRKFTEKQRF
jgi:hypothetical protein